MYNSPKNKEEPNLINLFKRVDSCIAHSDVGRKAQGEGPNSSFCPKISHLNLVARWKP
eukprot:m.94843 g.94843  ORF g.94843 m.94843 type:complete len:58 (+) comp26759_c0_seq1:221-394(+)